MKAAILATAALAGSACEESRTASPRSEREESVVRAPSVTIASVTKDPRAYDGHTVRLLGEIDGRVGRDLYVLRGPGVLWAATIPVIPAKSWRAIPLTDDDTVVVRGIVRARLTPSTARELGPAVSRAIGTGPYVIAGAIERQP